jgi:hypothetical protein
VKLKNDGGETAARLGEVVEASLEVLRLCGFVALMNGVVPDFPVRIVNMLLLIIFVYAKVTLPLNH